MGPKPNLPGAAVVVRAGDHLFEYTSGHRRFDDPTEISIGDGFPLVQIGKMIPDLVIAQLVEEGKLSYAATLGDIFPEIYKDRNNIRSNITVDQLVSHTSGFYNINIDNYGISDFFPPPTGLSQNQISSLRLKILEKSIDFPVKIHHSDQDYSSVHMPSIVNDILIGLIIEKYTGGTSQDSFRQRVFDPLGMNSCRFNSVLPRVMPPTRPWPHSQAERVADRQWETRQIGAHPITGPTYRINCSLSDWSKLLAEHLKIYRGKSQIYSRLNSKKYLWNTDINTKCCQSFFRKIGAGEDVYFFESYVFGFFIRAVMDTGTGMVSIFATNVQILSYSRKKQAELIRVLNELYEGTKQKILTLNREHENWCAQNTVGFQAQRDILAMAANDNDTCRSPYRETLRTLLGIQPTNRE